MTDTANRSVDIGDVTKLRERSALGAMVQTQPFWILSALLLICLAMSYISPTFGTADNFFNISKNFAYMGIVALGMTAVIITAGIDLSVGSIMGVAGIVTGLVMTAGYPMWVGLAACLATAAACGFVNGALIAYLNISPFVVTLGMLSIARSLALVISNNKMVYQFGPDEQLFIEIGGGSTFGVANPVWILAALTILFIWLFRYSTWGRHVFAVGGNAQAAKLNGIPVERIILSVYVVSAVMAGLAAFLMVGWLGSVTNALGTGFELKVIAASVIGGANLMGGQGYAIGAAIGAALVEVIRNSLLLAGVDPYWQGTFVGAFIILAVLLEKIRGRRPG